MKYQCRSCEEVMTFQGAEGVAGGSLRIAFDCPKCGHGISLITNAQETQLVKSMGITLGEVREGPPLGLVRSSLSRIRPDLSISKIAGAGQEEEPEEGLVWDDDAEKGLEKAPAVVRPMARVAIERYAREKGHRRITLQVMAEARERIGL